MKCGKEIESDSIECEWCYNWEHKECAGLSNDIYKVLDGAPVNVMFFCTKCEPKVKLALKFFDDIQQKQKLLDDRLQQLDEKFTKSINDINTRIDKSASLPVENAMEQAARSSPSNTKLPVSYDITSTLTSILAEEKEKEKRKLNLIIHKIPESTDDNAQIRKAYDLRQINTILQKHLNIETTIENAICLGKKDLAKTRLLKITVASLKLKKEILRNSSKLRNVSDPDWIQTIFITPDLTPKELEKDKALRAKLVELNATSKIYKIKNGEIVRREKH